MLRNTPMSYCLILIGTLTVLMTGQKAMAEAPFCTQSQTTAQQCYYYDAKQCRKEADILGGICVVNEESVNLPEGYGNYCLVISETTIECSYLDYSSCDQASKRQDGVCLRNNKKPDPLPSYQFQSQDAYQPF